MMAPWLTQASMHVFAILAIVVAPWLAYRRMRRLRMTGTSPLKTQLYRRTVGIQVMMTAVVLGLWLLGGIPAVRLGLCAPRAWWPTAAVGVAMVSYFIYVGLSQR